MTDAVSKNHRDATNNPQNFKAGDLAYALDNAAEFLENQEWAEPDGGAQIAANREAAKRLRRMASRQWAIAANGEK